MSRIQTGLLEPIPLVDPLWLMEVKSKPRHTVKASSSGQVFLHGVELGFKNPLYRPAPGAEVTVVTEYDGFVGLFTKSA